MGQPGGSLPCASLLYYFYGCREALVHETAEVFDKLCPTFFIAKPPSAPVNANQNECKQSPVEIESISGQLGLAQADYEPYGWHKAKLSLGLLNSLSNRPVAKYVGVTAISPTPLGEGKTVNAIGLSMALCRLGHQSIVTLREPSLAPVFGIKGGGAGGGRATVLPADEINLHFTGDMHAVTSAANLLAAMVDNHAKRQKLPRIAPDWITWRRCLDVSDKGLARIMTGLNDVPQAPRRETGFELTAASEVMAVLALATDLHDLRQRLGRIVVAQEPKGELVTAEDIGCAGAMAALLKDALRPNLVQTCEQTPAIVHSGPFGNIAHGNSSIVGDLIATRLCDYVVTESGFGADCGAEKFFNIKCRTSGLQPDVEVIVCTLRALKLHSGRFQVHAGKRLPAELCAVNEDALIAGVVNLQGHIEIIRRFGIPIVVTINRFPEDTDRELELVRKMALDFGAVKAVVSNAFAEGSLGAIELADAVVEAAQITSRFEFLYPAQMPLDQKIIKIATELYGASAVDFEPSVRCQLERFTELGFGTLPVCIAKTQYSLSHDPLMLGRPSGFRFPIRDVRLAAGAGYVYALAGDIQTMPGLPSRPAAIDIDIDERGEIRGLK